MMKHFSFSLFAVGTAAGLMMTKLYVLVLIAMLTSSADGYEVVFVMTADESLFKKHGDFIIVELERSNFNVTELKKKIEQKIDTTVSADRQTLTLRRESPYARSLNNDDNICFSALYFLSFDEFKIAIWYLGKKYNVWVKKTDTVTILKKKIQGVRSNLVPAGQKLYKLDLSEMEKAIKPKPNEKSIVEVINETGKALKKKASKFLTTVASYEHASLDTTPEQQQRKIDEALKIGEALKIDEALKKICGQALVVGEDGKTMTDYHIGKDANVYVEYNSVPPYVPRTEFEIFVWYGGKTYSIKVNRQDTVATVKNEIKKIIGIPPKRQTLRRNHPYAKAFTNGITMGCYAIEKELTFFLALDEFEIHVDFTWEKQGKKGNMYNVWVKRTDTVALLRKKINAVVHYNYELTSNICPAFPGYTVKLDENVKTVEQCGIEKGHVFQVKEKPIIPAKEGQTAAKKNKVTKKDEFGLWAPLL